MVVVLVGIMAGIALPRGWAAADRRATRAAARDVVLLLASARQLAATSAGGSAVAFDTGAAVLRLRVGGVGVRTLAVGTVYGVHLRANRDSLAWDTRGLGIGAANVTLVLTRAEAAESLFVSRLGRVRAAAEW